MCFALSVCKIQKRQNAIVYRKICEQLRQKNEKTRGNRCEVRKYCPMQIFNEKGTDHAFSSGY